MSKGSVTIKGVDELLVGLRRIDAAVRGEVAKAALGEAGDIVVEAARGRVPVRTGKLRDSIEWAYREEDGVPAIRVGPSAGTKASRREGFYGLFIELGVSNARTTKPKSGSRNRGRMRSQPFMRPAVDAEQGRITETVRSRLAAEIERLADG